MPYNFLQDFHVKFGETVKKYFDVRKGDTDGFFVVTDKRFVWQKKGALHPEVRVHSGLLPESSKTTAVVPGKDSCQGAEDLLLEGRSNPLSYSQDFVQIGQRK